MIEEQYARWTAPLRANPRAARALLAANKLLTCVGYVAYPLLLALLAASALAGGASAGELAAAGGVGAGELATGAAGGAASAEAAGANGDAGAAHTGALAAWWPLACCVAVPSVLFAACSLFRRVVNAPRPYEALPIDPLIKKDTRGKSFPSRHAFSMFTIAAAWMTFQPVVGAALMAAGAFMGGVRVLGGVHYPRDVIAGAASALVLSAAAYALCGLL
ncbi:MULTISPECIES: phosphatase PAP2 family protein [unclassified Adlercreutzia]|uniref:phosphatase PAP2 family protein n=1 Tax=unclassified Adlercreutzia TaxID=2636013 RepID=UPI001F14EC29|nr:MULTISPECIES: phosphatase PAP2 family protein [unclassified Adlercreutzia]